VHGRHTLGRQRQRLRRDAHLGHHAPALRQILLAQPQIPRHVCEVLGQDGRPLQGNPLGDQHVIAHASPTGPHRLAPRRGPQGRDGDQGPGEARRVPSVPPDDRDSDLPGRTAGVAHDLLKEFLVLHPRHQHQQLDPARRDTGRSDVVTRHVDRQPPDVPDGADDGIYMGYQYVPPDLRHRHVLTESSAQNNVRIVSLNEGKDTPL